METTYEYEVFNGVAPNPGGGVYPGPNAWTGIPELVFATGTVIIMAWIHDQRAVVRFAFDGVTYGDDIVLYPALQAEPFYLSAQSVQVINFTNGSFANYQIMGQW